MGLCITQTKSQFSLPKTNIPSAIDAIKTKIKKAVDGQELSYDDSLFFSETNRSLLSLSSLFKLMWPLGWLIEIDELKGGIIGVELVKEKYHSDLALFNTLAPFIEPYSFLSFKEKWADEPEHYLWLFDGTRCQYLKIQFGEHTELISLLIDDNVSSKDTGRIIFDLASSIHKLRASVY